MSKLSISESGLISSCPFLFPISEYGITIHKAPILGVISNNFFFLLPSIANHLLLHVHLLLLVHYFLSNLLSLHHHCWLTYSTTMISQVHYLKADPLCIFIAPPPGSQSRSLYFKMEIQIWCFLAYSLPRNVYNNKL